MYQKGNTELLAENASCEMVARFLMSQPDLQEVLFRICFKDEFLCS